MGKSPMDDLKFLTASMGESACVIYKVLPDLISYCIVLL